MLAGSMSFWIVALVSLIPLWLLQNVIHELAHGLTIKIGWGWDFKIYPFPSYKIGRFTFAHVKYYQTEKSKNISEVGWGLISLMPRIVNSIIMFLLPVFIAIFQSNHYVVAPLLVFLWCNYIDFIIGLLVIFKSDKSKSDVWMVQKYWKLTVKNLKVDAVFFTVLFGFLVCGITALTLFA